mgnify:CR=1 FL=1|jgi:hypothetical protein
MSLRDSVLPPHLPNPLSNPAGWTDSQVKDVLSHYLGENAPHALEREWAWQLHNALGIHTRGRAEEVYSYLISNYDSRAAAYPLYDDDDDEPPPPYSEHDPELGVHLGTGNPPSSRAFTYHASQRIPHGRYPGMHQTHEGSQFNWAGIAPQSTSASHMYPAPTPPSHLFGRSPDTDAYIRWDDTLNTTPYLYDGAHTRGARTPSSAMGQSGFSGAGSADRDPSPLRASSLGNTTRISSRSPHPDEATPEDHTNPGTDPDSQRRNRPQRSKWKATSCLSWIDSYAPTLARLGLAYATWKGVKGLGKLWSEKRSLEDR